MTRVDNLSEFSRVAGLDVVFNKKGNKVVPNSVQQVERQPGNSGDETLRVRFLNGEHTTAANAPQARTKSWNN